MEARRTNVHWKPHEWDLIIRELITRHPIAMSSKTLVGIKKKEVTAAMERVIPFERWRASMNMDSVRPTLSKRYAEVHAMMVAERTQSAKEHRLAQLQAAGLHNLSEEAVEVVAKLVISRLEPILEAYVDGRIKGLLPPMAVEAIIATHRERAKPKMPKIGVIGLLPIQQESVKKTFPELDFSFADNRGSGIKSSFRNMDVVFGLVAKMSHDAEDALRTMPEVWQNYKRVGGKGTSAVIRSVEIWAKDNYRSTLQH